jgi:hypothetical protein
VSVQFAAFSPGDADVLPGETVTWTNVSERNHTVDADDGSFASGALAPGATFSQVLDAVGAHPYHCTIHAGMTGVIDVSRVTLGPLPTAAIPAGERVAFTGRTADPAQPVTVQRLAPGGPEAIATAHPAADGAWAVTVPVVRGGDVRAVSASGASGTRRLIVSDRKVLLRITGRRVAVRVVPALPSGRVALQEHLRDHFGWWPVGRTRLDYVSEASFRIRRPVRLRVALLDADGWTPLAMSRVVTLRAPARSSSRVSGAQPDHPAG